MRKIKKDSWKEKIDPSFDELIKTYRKFLEYCNLPSNNGYICLDNTLIKNIGYPSLGKEYLSKMNAVKKAFSSVLSTKELKSIKPMPKFKQSKSKKNAIKELNFLPENSRDYYINKYFTSVGDKQDLINKDSKKAMEEWLSDSFGDFITLMWHEGLVDGWESNSKSNKTTKKKKSKIANTILIAINDSISKLAQKKPIYDLIYEAKKGNDNALFKALQTDKTLIDLEWIRKRIRKAQYEGDSEFFKNLGNSFQKDPLDHNIEFGELVLVLSFCWNLGLYRLTNDELMELLDASGLKIQDDQESFRKYMNRLKKTKLLDKIDLSKILKKK